MHEPEPSLFEVFEFQFVVACALCRNAHAKLAVDEFAQVEHAFQVGEPSRKISGTLLETRVPSASKQRKSSE